MKRNRSLRSSLYFFKLFEITTKLAVFFVRLQCEMCNDNDVMMIRQVIMGRGKKKDNLLIADLFAVTDHIVTNLLPRCGKEKLYCLV